MDWEKVVERSYEWTDRLKVFGGWVLRTRDSNDNNDVSVAMVFISDPKHEWTLK